MAIPPRDAAMQPIILVRNPKTRALVHAEPCEKSALAPPQLVQSMTRKVRARADRYGGPPYPVVEGKEHDKKNETWG